MEEMGSNDGRVIDQIEAAIDLIKMTPTVDESLFRHGTWEICRIWH